MRVFLENDLFLAVEAAKRGLPVDTAKLSRALVDQLDKIAREDYPIAAMRRDADLILRAEGPGAAHGLPWLSALNWITRTAETNLRSLSAATLDLLGVDGKTLSKALDLRLTGLAPGSLYVGLRYMPPPADLLPEDAESLKTVARGANLLPDLVQFIEDDRIDPGIADIAPDPALRDAQLGALLKFSPTGKLGIHTLDIASTHSDRHARLSQRERVVLNQALKQPDFAHAQYGSFVGEVREADLDKTRIHLRRVTDVGTLRCILRALSPAQGKSLRGSAVRVTGHYQSDRAGRPRLLQVESIEPIKQGKLKLPPR